MHNLSYNSCTYISLHQSGRRTTTPPDAWIKFLATCVDQGIYSLVPALCAVSYSYVTIVILLKLFFFYFVNLKLEKTIQ